MTPIAGYVLEWNFVDKKGVLRITLGEGNEYPIEASSPAELAALALVLKQEPVYLSQDGTSIHTEWERPGA